MVPPRSLTEHKYSNDSSAESIRGYLDAAVAAQ
jgi:hypothetical protein